MPTGEKGERWGKNIPLLSVEVLQHVVQLFGVFQHFLLSRFETKKQFPFHSIVLRRHLFDSLFIESRIKVVPFLEICDEFHLSLN